MSQNVLKCLKMSQNVLRCLKMSKDVSRCQKMSVDVLKCLKMFLNVSKYLKMSQDVSKCHKFSTIKISKNKCYLTNQISFLDGNICFWIDKRHVHAHHVYFRARMRFRISRVLAVNSRDFFVAFVDRDHVPPVHRFEVLFDRSHVRYWQPLPVCPRY